MGRAVEGFLLRSHPYRFHEEVHPMDFGTYKKRILSSVFGDLVILAAQTKGGVYQ